MAAIGAALLRPGGGRSGTGPARPSGRGLAPHGAGSGGARAAAVPVRGEGREAGRAAGGLQLGPFTRGTGGRGGRSAGRAGEGREHQDGNPGSRSGAWAPPSRAPGERCGAAGCSRALALPELGPGPPARQP